MSTDFRRGERRAPEVLVDACIYSVRGRCILGTCVVSPFCPPACQVEILPLGMYKVRAPQRPKGGQRRWDGSSGAHMPPSKKDAQSAVLTCCFTEGDSRMNAHDIWHEAENMAPRSTLGKPSRLVCGWVAGLAGSGWLGFDSLVSTGYRSRPVLWRS
ncbi:hypothetical protein LZ32DRAFT_106596 [Colletotrichum eremochloae]|nr:hypothetical protein LZ32DRAFT_106596 [Colletotrichum eremochloae]